jgi:hypothetical protein
MRSPPARKAILTRVQKALSMRASCSGDQSMGHDRAAGQPRIGTNVIRLDPQRLLTEQRTRPGVAPIFAWTVRPITVPDGTIMVMYGTFDPFVLVLRVATYGAQKPISRITQKAAHSVSTNRSGAAQ